MPGITESNFRQMRAMCCVQACPPFSFYSDNSVGAKIAVSPQPPSRLCLVLWNVCLAQTDWIRFRMEWGKDKSICLVFTALLGWFSLTSCPGDNDFTRQEVIENLQQRQSKDQNQNQNQIKESKIILLLGKKRVILKGTMHFGGNITYPSS